MRYYFKFKQEKRSGRFFSFSYPSFCGVSRPEPVLANSIIAFRMQTSRFYFCFCFRCCVLIQLQHWLHCRVAHWLQCWAVGPKQNLSLTHTFKPPVELTVLRNGMKERRSS
jgi:hypothetical protein